MTGVELIDGLPTINSGVLQSEWESELGRCEDAGMSCLRDSGITGYALLIKSMRRRTTVYRRVTFAGIGQFPESDPKLTLTDGRLREAESRWVPRHHAGRLVSSCPIERFNSPNHEAPTNDPRSRYRSRNDERPIVMSCSVNDEPGDDWRDDAGEIRDAILNPNARLPAVRGPASVWPIANIFGVANPNAKPAQNKLITDTLRSPTAAAARLAAMITWPEIVSVLRARLTLAPARIHRSDNQPIEYVLAANTRYMRPPSSAICSTERPRALTRYSGSQEITK